LPSVRSHISFRCIHLMCILASENIGDKPREGERGATPEENPSYPDLPGEEQPQGSPSNDQQVSEETTNALSQRGSEVEPPKTHTPHLLRPPTHSPTHQQVRPLGSSPIDEMQPHRNNGEGNYVAKTNTVQSLRPQIPPMGTPLQPHINVQPSTHFSSFSSHVVAPPYNHSASHQGSTAHSVPLSHSHSVPPSHSNSLPQRPHFQPIPLLPPNTHHSSTYDDSDGDHHLPLPSCLTMMTCTVSHHDDMHVSLTMMTWMCLSTDDEQDKGRRR